MQTGSMEALLFVNRSVEALLFVNTGDSALYAKIAEALLSVNITGVDARNACTPSNPSPVISFGTR